MALFNPFLAGRTTATEFGTVRFDERGIAENLSPEQEEKFVSIPNSRYSKVKLVDGRIVPEDFGEEEIDNLEGEGKTKSADHPDDSKPANNTINRDVENPKGEQEEEEETDEVPEDLEKEAVAQEEIPELPEEYADITVAKIEQKLQEAGKEIPEGTKRVKYDEYVKLFD